MYAYRTPGVVFEWRDTRTRAIDILRTDIAGFVGIAERGPLHLPVKLESWTQFTSIFGGHMPQGYLAYAVEGFFANGGQTCWVVRVAHPSQARRARLVLLDGGGQPVLELTAAHRSLDARDQPQARALRLAGEDGSRPDPGTWAHKVTVAVIRSGRDRFSLILRLADGAPEIWRNLSMQLASLDLLDSTGIPVLHLDAWNPMLWEHTVEVSVAASDLGADYFSLRLRALKDRQEIFSEIWPHLTLRKDDEEHYVERVLGNQASYLVIARDLLALQRRATGTASSEVLKPATGMSYMQPEPRYVERVLNDPATGSRLVSVRCLNAGSSRESDGVPSPQAPNLRNSIGRLAGGQDGLAPSVDLRGADQQPRLRLIAKIPTRADEPLSVKVEPDGEGRFKLELKRAGQTKPEESWPSLTGEPQPKLTVDPPYLDLFDDAGHPTLRLITASPERRDIEVQVARTTTDRFDLVVRTLDGSRTETWRDLTKNPADSNYVETVLNNPQNGSLLVLARDLTDGHPNPPARDAINLRNGVGRLGYGPPHLDLLDSAGQPTLRLSALAYAGAGIQVTVARSRRGADRFDLTLRPPDGSQPETWADLSMQPADPRYVKAIVNESAARSRLVRAELLASNTPDPERSQRAAWLPDRVYAVDALNDPLRGSKLVAAYDILPAMPGMGPEPYNLAGGSFDLIGGLDPRHFYLRRDTLETSWGIATFEKAETDEISIVAMPDIMPKPWLSVSHRPQPPRCEDLDSEPLPPLLIETPPEYPPRFDDTAILALQLELIGHCERLKDRIAILDPRIDDTTPEQVLAWRRKFDTTYAALYYPWIMAPDPLRLEGLLRALPPSGHVAGVYARVDRLVGVHKPPANEALDGVLDIATTYFDRLRAGPPSAAAAGGAKDTLAGIDDIIHGVLNGGEVNVIRPYPGRGVRIAGARLLSSDSELRYVNVRRLLLMIEEAIDERTQWTVFEPNDQSLWLDIERVVASFLNTLWRRGMLDGGTAEEAYSVRCDAATNPPEEIALGRVICEIGVLPPWPAEFVIVRIGKTEDGIVVLQG